MAPPKSRVAGQSVRRAVQQQARIPAPSGGLNFVDGTLGMPESDAWLLDNFVVRPYGVEVRKGWQYWSPESSPFAGEVRSVLVYNAKKVENSKVWTSAAASSGELYDTPFNAARVLDLTPSTVPSVIGEWYGTNYITDAGSFYCAVTHEGGYYVYSVNEATNVGTWTEVTTGPGAGQIQFPPGDPTTTKDFCFVWAWKSRLWFLKNNSSVAYYLPTNAISGTVAEFDFGGQLLHGGNLAWCTSWTYDSGAGIDDGLIIASEQGDVLIYQGTDPASAATFSLKGSWYVGRFPVGRRGYAQHGGDCLVITEYGVIAVSDLVSGRIQTSLMRGEVARKINPQLSRIVSGTITEKYWGLLLVPAEGFVLLYGPYINAVTGIRQGFLMNSITNAWSSFSDIDVLSANILEGELIIGTRDGHVIKGFVGYTDGMSSDGLTFGAEVTGRIQSAFLDYGDATKNKRMLRSKIYGLVDADPAIYVTFKPEYVINELLNTPSPVLQEKPIWEISVWDSSLWTDSSASFHKWFGVTGYGKKLSMQAAVRSTSAVLITDYEVLFETGIGL